MPERGDYNNQDKHKNEGSAYERYKDKTLEELMAEQDADEKAYYEYAENKRRDRKKRKKQDERDAETRKRESQHRIAEKNRLDHDMRKANRYKDLDKIRFSNYDLNPSDTRKLKRKLDSKKRKQKEKELNKRDFLAVEAAQTGVTSTVGLIPFIGIGLAWTINRGIALGNRVKNKAVSRFSVSRDNRKNGPKRSWTNRLGTFVAKVGAGVAFLYIFLAMMLLTFALATGGIISILLSHPEGIVELHANNMLGDAMWMGNVSEDIEVNGEIIMKGRPDASPGCFIYNGVWYCGNCNVVGGVNDNPSEPGNCAVNYDDAGQGEFTPEAEEWAKTFNATFIGDSLGVGVEPSLSGYFPNMNFDVLGSRWLVYNGDVDSTDTLNGIDILRKLASAGDVQDTLVVALGTNGGFGDGDLEAFYNEIPDNVKKTIFVNTGSKGGVDYDQISKDIKDFAGTKDDVGYLDWQKFSHGNGWENYDGGDEIHMSGEGYTKYAQFITQGLYDIFNTSCAIGDVQIGNVSDDPNHGIPFYPANGEGLQPWVKRVGDIVGNLFPEVETLGGYRAGDPQDHGLGLALDVMVPVGSVEKSGELGDVIAQWAVDNMEALNISYVIWQQRIYGNWNNKWEVMEDRHSITQNHFDHPHISFAGGEGNYSAIKAPTGQSVNHSLNDPYRASISNVPILAMGTIGTLKTIDNIKQSIEPTRVLASEDSSQYIGTADGPGTLAYSPESGYTEGIIADFDIRTKNPAWLDGAYIDRFLQENSHGDSPIVGHGDDIVRASEDSGIAAGLFLGQIAKETTFGKADCGGEFNIGCFESVGGQPSDWGTVGRWAAPPSIYSATMRYFEVVANYDAKTYSEYKEIYAPRCDNQQTCSVDINPMSEFENYTFGVLRALGYDITGNGATSTPSNNNNNDPNGFVCPDNCQLTEDDKKQGTGNQKSLPKGEAWENGDEIILTDLNYVPDSVTEAKLNEFIRKEGPDDNGLSGLGGAFYEAGQKSGYDPRYLLAHTIHETSWGTSSDFKQENNPYNLMEEGHNGSIQLKKFSNQKAGIVEGAMLIFKNYYSNGQKNLWDMHNDPNGDDHNISDDPEWSVKVASYMKNMEEYMGQSSGGSVRNNRGDVTDIRQERASQTTLTTEMTEEDDEDEPSSTSSGLGRSCLIDEFDGDKDVSFSNLPFDPNEMVISSFYRDGNYAYGPTHNGMDATYSHGGTGPIYAVEDGVVEDITSTCSVGNRNCGEGWGNQITIHHDSMGDGTWRTRYAHMDTISVSVGDKVSAGDQIGMMGTTGQSDGIHLHFEVQHGESSDYRVDMYPLFAWEDATYTPGWENYAGPHTGDKCTPGAAGTTAPGGNNRNAQCDVNDPSRKGGNGLIGDTEAEQVYHFFSGHGFSDAAIAGILGNLMQESGVRAKMIQGRGNETKDMTEAELDELLERSIYIWSDPSIPGEGVGPAVGISQWEHAAFYNGSLNPGRWEGVMAWSKKNGYSHWDTEAQLEYIIREMGVVDDPDVPLEYGVTLINNAQWACNSDEGCQVGIQGFENFMKTDDVEAAVRTYFQFNRAGHAAMSNRYEYAHEFYAMMDDWK